jgi:hypothetical protein
MTLLKELRSLPNPCDQAPKRSPLPGSGASLEGKHAVLCMRVLW